jgi:hypothetical protein
MGEKSPQVAGDEPTDEFHVQASGQAPDFMKPSPGRHTKHKIHNAGFEPEVNDDDCAETSTAWRGLENQEPTLHDSGSSVSRISRSTRRQTS